MRSGALDRRVRIEELTTTRNAVGEDVQSWSTLATVWAQRAPQSVVQRYSSDQLYSEITAVFRIRWEPYGSIIDPAKHRLVYRDRVYDIHGAEETKRMDGVDILTKARLDNESGTN